MSNFNEKCACSVDPVKNAEGHAKHALITHTCPEDCVGCTEHETRPCCVLLEITARCNLGCPVCFADSRQEENVTLADPSLQTIELWYRKLFEQAGSCHIQLSGGEPTLREDLEDIISLGKMIGFTYFQLNTNGIRLAEEPDLALRLKEAGLTCVFLQFDGMTDEVHRAIRGRNLQAIKETAVKRCAEAKLPVVLVPTVAKGVNDHELMPLIQYGIKNSPTVRGIHIQPLAHFGRVDIDVESITNAEVIELLQQQSEGMISTSHFSGGNAEHPLCSFNAHYFINDDDELSPSGVQRPSCCGDTVEQAKSIQEKRWGTDISDLPATRPKKGTMDEFLWQMKMRSFAITGMAFMDEQSMDLERMRRCYLFIVNPDGDPVPFCAYNIAHRGLYTKGS